MKHDSLRGIETYAIPILDWLDVAIREFRKSRITKELPKFIVMNPVAYASLKMDIRMLNYQFGAGQQDEPSYRGILIIVEDQTKGIKFITADNKVEFI